MVAESRSGQMNAWLLKKKSGTSMVRVRQYNKRFFTIDFDSRVFFYAHAENSKKASTVIPFADIIDAQWEEDKKNEALKPESSRGFLMRRSGSMQEQHIVTVVTRPARTMELLCGSATEAHEWFEALRAAVAMEHGGQGTAGNLPWDLTVPDAVGAGPNGESGSSEDGKERAPTGLHAEAPSAERGPGDSHKACIDPVETVREEPPPKGAPGTFLDFSTEPAEPESPQGRPVVDGRLEAVVAANAAEVEELISPPHGLQAADFGLDDGKESSSSEDSADRPTEAPGGSPLRGHLAELSGGEGRQAAEPGRSYRDQNEGLSMQERLQNLEFSDCEDDDDDPLGLGDRSEAAKG